MYKTYFKYKNLKKFGVPVEQIEGFEEAITSPENYVIHHVLEWKYSTKELIEMNRYDNVTADELMFVPASIHSSSLYIHKDKINSINALKNLSKEQRAENQRKAANANIGKTRRKETKDKMSNSFPSVS